MSFNKSPDALKCLTALNFYSRMPNANNSIDKEDAAAAQHGGDILAVARKFGIAPEKLLDFSANINPRQPPARVLQRLKADAANVELLARYPDAELAVLRRALAKHVGTAENQIIIANGAAALIQIAVRAVSQLYRKSSCLLPVPAFSEYERALSAADFKISRFQLEPQNNFALDEKMFIERLELEKPQLCILNNPHNPSGALTEPAILRRLIRAAQTVGTIVLLDEAFIDYTPDQSLTAEVGKTKNLIVLRSLTKFFAIPALRVGYAVAADGLCNRLNRQIEAWSVTTLAANAAAEALGDVEYARATLQENQIEREFLSGELSALGCRVFSSAANFLLLELPPNIAAAKDFRSRLITEHQIIVRDCSSYCGLENKNMIRVAVHRRRENTTLVRAVQTVFNRFKS